jgi:hypothetical protein
MLIERLRIEPENHLTRKPLTNAAIKEKADFLPITISNKKNYLR